MYCVVRHRLPCIAVVVGLWGVGCDGPSTRPVPPARETVSPVPLTTEQVRAFCGDCHAYPSPETFPKGNWRSEVRRGFEFFRKSGKANTRLVEESVIEYYVDRAPEALPALAATPDSTPPVSFRTRALAGPPAGEPSAIANLRVVRLSDAERPDILACDMAGGVIWAHRAGDSGDRLTKLASHLGNPAHLEAIDLDGDGLRDLVVADLGVPLPSDQRQGRVLWLRAQSDGRFERVVLVSGLGRVCDVQAADFDGDGDLDLIAAVFGWHDVGEVLLLENQGMVDGQPRFAPRTIDRRHGAIHVPVADLDGDGRPDFVALISQEFETVVAFHNEGEGRFTPTTLFEADHPAFGSSGIDLADLDGDGDLDVVLTNGDVYDSPVLKPYHGVSWLENKGLGQPFERHAIGALYGAHRARAVDLDGDGDLDLVAAGFLGSPFYAQARRASNVDAIVLFEQSAPGRFERHALERVTADYPTFDVADLDGDGRPDLVFGRFQDFRFAGVDWSPRDRARTDLDPIVIWHNLGPRSRDQ